MAIKTIYYERWDFNYKGSLSIRKSRSESYDEDYGTAGKSVRTPHRLGLVEGDSIKERWVALRELVKPIWGENNDLPFGEVLPTIETLPPKTIKTGPQLYNQAPDYFKPTEFGTYELSKEIGDGRRQIIRFPYEKPEDLVLWDILYDYGMFTHFKLEGSANYIENPDYAPALAEQQAKLTEAEELLRQTFRVIGKHQFPGLPLNDRLITSLLATYNDPNVTPYFENADDIPEKCLWKWFEKIDSELISIPVDSEHPLAVTNPRGGWTFLRKPMRPSLEEPLWDDFARRLIGYTDPRQKCKRILNII